MRARLFVLIVSVTNIGYAADSEQADGAKADAVEAGGSCVVIHDKSHADGDKNVTCFENVALERTAFESGVCQWKTDAQANEDVKTTTKFVEYCPTSYSAYCDRLVLGPNVTAPVKIFVYNKSDSVLARARKQCLSGGGKWTVDEEESE